MMNRWLLPWKPFILLADVRQLVPLVDALPQPWTTIWFTLFTIYCVFLVIRENPWYNVERLIPSKKLVVKQQNVGAKRTRRRKRSQRSRSK